MKRYKFDIKTTWFTKHYITSSHRKNSHMVIIMAFKGWFVINRLALAMINLCTNVRNKISSLFLFYDLMQVVDSSILLNASQVAQSRQPCVNSHWLSLWETCIFDPPQNRRPLTGSLKNLSRVITSTTSTSLQNLVIIRPCGASGQIGKI